MRPSVLIHVFAAAVLVCVSSIHASHAATGSDPVAVEPVDIAPCLAATAADDMEKAFSACTPVIDNEKTAKPDRVKALIARGALAARHDQLNQAISDYGRALQLDPSLADIFNARGELWLKQGNRPRAVQDFGAALKLNPNHEKAKANHKAMARELERIGAQMAVAGKPSFSCARARRAVEKAICGDRELADLDREIIGSHERAIREAKSMKNPNPDARALQREQDEFIARRNAEFGRPGYDLKKAMKDRLQRINGVDGY